MIFLKDPLFKKWSGRITFVSKMRRWKKGHPIFIFVIQFHLPYFFFHLIELHFFCLFQFMDVYVTVFGHVIFFLSVWVLFKMSRLYEKKQHKSKKIYTVVQTVRTFNFFFSRFMCVSFVNATCFPWLNLIKCLNIEFKESRVLSNENAFLSAFFFFISSSSLFIYTFLNWTFFFRWNWFEFKDIFEIHFHLNFMKTFEQVNQKASTILNHFLNFEFLLPKTLSFICMWSVTVQIWKTVCEWQHMC